MNKRLIIGICVTVIMLLVAVLGPYLAPYRTTDQIKISYVDNELVVPPIKPGAEHLLGTDKNGYDLLTQLLYGAKYTIFSALVISLVKVFAGGLIGMHLGYSREKSGAFARYLNLLNGIPIFLLAFFILYGININPTLPTLKLVAVSCAVLIVLGLPSVVAVIQDKTREVKKKQFVLAASSLGAGKWRIVSRHIFPHLKESFLILLINETILALTLFGQLGIFNIFIGGTKYSPQGEPASWVPITHEWSGMIGSSRFFMYVYHWIIWAPLGAYLILIIGLYLISIGLEAQYRQRYSKYSQI